MAVGAQGGTIGLQPLFENLFRRQPRHEQRPVAFDPGNLERFWAGDAPVDGRMGFLNWPGRYREFRNLPELPLIGDPLLCPGLLNDRQRFLIALAVFPPWYAKPVKVLGIGPAPHAEDEAPTAENIEHGEVFCLAEGVLQGEYAEGRAVAQAGGCLRHGGQKELWARTDAKGIEMLLAHPNRIEAELFSVNHAPKAVFVVGDLRLTIGEKVK